VHRAACRTSISDMTAANEAWFSLLAQQSLPETYIHKICAKIKCWTSLSLVKYIIPNGNNNNNNDRLTAFDPGQCFDTVGWAAGRAFGL